MLINKLQKKFSDDPAVMRVIEGEVQCFLKNSIVGKESIKDLEIRINRKLNPSV